MLSIHRITFTYRSRKVSLPEVGSNLFLLNVRAKMPNYMVSKRRRISTEHYAHWKHINPRQHIFLPAGHQYE